MGAVEFTPTDGGFFQYCSYLTNPYMSINCQVDSIAKITIIQISTTAILNYTDFECFSTNLVSVTLKNSTLIGDFFSTWPLPAVQDFTIDTMTSTNNLVLSPLSNFKTDFTLKMYQQTTETIIPLSYLRSLSGVGRYSATTNENSVLSTTSHNIKYLNDVDLPVLQLYSFDVVTMNLPSFKNVKISLATITLAPGFDRQSLLDNITTIKRISTFRLTSPVDSIPFPTRIVEANSMEFLTLIIDGKLEAPTSIIDLTALNSIFSINLRNVGDDFLLNGNPPLKFGPGLSLEFSGGKINTFDLAAFNNPSHLYAKNNKMGGTLPSIKPSNLKTLEIQDNQMTGTIDSSYCKLASFAFQNNKFNGKIPSCFTCYFNIVSSLNLDLTSLFSGNNFDTTPPTSTCTSIVPNIKFDRFFKDQSQFIVFGQNLGFEKMETYITTDIGDTSVKYLEFSTAIEIQVPTSSVPSSKIIKLIYNVFDQPQEFSLSWDPLEPQIQTVTWSNDFNLQFDGSYFSYNKSLMSITIDGKDCLIASATFNQIICSLSDKVAQGSKTLLTYVTIGKLTTQITLNPNTVNTILNCTAQFNDCNGGGYCNSEFGTCICDSNHQGEACEITRQTLSSVNASSTEGGEAVFYGWFGKVHSEPSLSIGGKDCKITSITETVLICTAPAGNGVQTVIFTQNLYTYTINNFYEYKTIGKSCPNDCTSNINGKCNSMTGYCQCIGNWGGYDCSLYRNDNTGSDSSGTGNFPSTNITINGTDGNTNLNNQQTNYEISITSLIEFDLSGNQIKNYPLLNNWSVKTTNNITKDIYQFIQTIQKGACNITFILEDIKVTRNISFAGLEFQLESGSVKMTIIIDNYQYSSNLNTLQLQMKSTVSEIKSNDSNECNNENIEINTIGDYDNSLNYLSIKKNAKVLSGRFLNRVESDGKSTYSQTTVVSKSNETVVIGMNLPHFKQSIKIDPDFSVLISPEFKSECEDDSNRKWVIPVAVCVSVAGAAAIVAAAFLIYRKQAEKPFLLKMKNLKKFSSEN